MDRFGLKLTYRAPGTPDSLKQCFKGSERKLLLGAPVFSVSDSLSISVSMLSLRGGGGGGGQAYVGHLTSIAFPTLANLTMNLGPKVGTFAFLCRGMGPSHIVPCARLCASHLGSACVEIESISNWTCTSCK